MKISLIYRCLIYSVFFTVSAVLSFFGFPLVLWFSFLFLIVVLFEGSTLLVKTTYSDTYQFLSLLFVVGFLIRVCFALGITYFFEINYGNALGKNPEDELTYYRNSLDIARGVRSHIKLNSDAGASYYYALLAYITNGNIYLMKMINAIVASLIPVQTYFLATKIANDRIAKGSAIFSVFFPLYLIHVGFLFKESIMLVLLLVALNMLFNVRKRLWLLKLVILILSIASIFLFRTITAISLIVITALIIYLRTARLRPVVLLSLVVLSYILLFVSPFGHEILSYASLLNLKNIGGYLGFLLQSDGLKISPILYFQFLFLSIIGPLPSLIEYTSDYLILLAPYRYIKVMMSPFIFYGLLLLVKDCKDNLAVIGYVVLNFLGIWFTGFFLIDIFQFIFYPLFIIGFFRAIGELSMVSLKFILYYIFSGSLIIYWNVFL